MLGMNTVCVVGTVGECRGMSYTAKGTALLKFTLEIKRPSFSKTGGDPFFTSRVPVTAWGKRAESMGVAGVATGRNVAVRGELRIKHEKAEKDGVSYWKTDVSVNADEVVLLDGDNAPARAEVSPEEPYPDLPGEGGKE